MELPLLEQRVDKEVDIVSMVRVRIFLTMLLKKPQDFTSQIGSTKVQVRRTDTIESIADAIRSDNEVEGEAVAAGKKGVFEIIPKYESFKFVQGGISIRRNQTAALLFEDRYSNVADAEIYYNYSYPPPTFAKIIINASVSVEVEKGAPSQAALLPTNHPFTNVRCTDTLDSVIQRVRSEFNADGEAQKMGGVGNPISVCYHGSKLVPAKDAVSTYFPDPYTPIASFHIRFVFQAPATSECCSVM